MPSNHYHGYFDTNRVEYDWTIDFISKKSIMDLLLFSPTLFIFRNRNKNNNGWIQFDSSPRHNWQHFWMPAENCNATSVPRSFITIELSICCSICMLFMSLVLLLAFAHFLSAKFYRALQRENFDDLLISLLPTIETSGKNFTTFCNLLGVLCYYIKSRLYFGEKCKQCTVVFIE